MARPNLVVFVSDDQGYEDLSCMGSTDVRTPHLDALAASGALLTDWYANSPVCTPSRASLLTGRYPGNAGVRSILSGFRTTPGLRTEVPTLSSVLRAAGYRTGWFGKWHLGAAPGFRPQDHGFEDTFGFHAGSVDYYSHIYYGGDKREIVVNGRRTRGTPVHDLWRGGEEVYRDGRYLTELIGDHTVDFVRACTSDDRPFLLYVPFNAPHYPMHAPQLYKDRFPDLPPERQIMTAMISAMDDAVGRVLAELDRQHVRDDTMCLFMSDNGPSREVRNWLDGSQQPYYGGSAGTLKGHKFSLFEGGIRVPGIVSWPGRIPAGQVVSEPAAAIDLYPTFLNAAGIEPPDGHVDGVDIMGMLTAGEPSPHDALMWEQGDQTAVRRGRWKLVLNGRLVEREEPQDEVFLADLTADNGERVNLAHSHPETVDELRHLAETWRDGIEERWRSHWLPRIPDYATHVQPAFME
ncbi:MAG: sulfatase-like hydrolase/transferase [Streptosporangiales bacterium]|nr:sulfatase-like hydrolase/transferase [Streptosporangiales bacterium]